MKAMMFLAMASLVPGAFLMQASGGSSVAVIDFDRAISETPEGKEAINKLTAFGNEQRTAIEAKAKEADDLATRLRNQNSVLSAAARDELNQNLDAARTAVQTMQEEAQNKAAQLQAELLSPIEQKTTNAVTAYAAERGLKIVLDAAVLRSGLVYVHDTADITSEIIRRIASNAETSGQKNVFVVPQDKDLMERLQERLQSRKWFDVNLEAASEAVSKAD